MGWVTDPRCSCVSLGVGPDGAEAQSARTSTRRERERAERRPADDEVPGQWSVHLGDQRYGSGWVTVLVSRVTAVCAMSLPVSEAPVRRLIMV